MEVKANLKECRVATSRARLMADLVRGKGVSEALRELAGQSQKSALIVSKLIRSAISNAEQKKVVDLDNLYVKKIEVGQGPSLKRFMPRAQGRAFQIRKKTSHFNLTLDER